LAKELAVIGLSFIEKAGVANGFALNKVKLPLSDSTPGNHEVFLRNKACILRKTCFMFTIGNGNKKIFG